MTRLHQYLSRLHDTILSRREIEIEALEIFDRSDKVGQSSEFYVRLRFYDQSRLEVVEKLIVENYTIAKSRYVYHYQKEDGKLIIRYDNAPQHPEVSTHPHHKHIDDKVIAAQPPDLSDVLHEIDGILYSTQSR